MNSYNIVNFSYLLINKIISYLESIDRICFSLSCKKLFNERSRYLKFNCRKLRCLKTQPFKTHIKFYLHSYKEVFLKSANLYSKSTLFINGHDEKLGHKYEYHLIYKDPNQFKDIVIEDDVNKIKISYSYNMIDNLPQLYDTIYSNKNRHNIKSMDFGIISNRNSTDNLRLMESLEKINVSSISEPFYESCLPKSIKVLKLNKYDFILEKKILQPLVNLSSLHLLPYKQCLKIDVGVLPNSLQILKILNYCHPLEVGTLPTNLKQLLLLYDYRSGQTFENLKANVEGVLPRSLIKVRCPLLYINEIKSLSALRKLTIDYPKQGQPILLDSLPKSIVSLKFLNTPLFNINYLRGTFNQNIQSLRLTLYSLVSTNFPSTIQSANSKSLATSSKQQTNDQSITVFQPIYYKSIYLGCCYFKSPIPSHVHIDTLTIMVSQLKERINGAIECDYIRVFELYGKTDMIFDYLPSSIELDIHRLVIHKNIIPASIIPSSVTTLHTNTSFFEYNPIDTLSSSITTIKISNYSSNHNNPVILKRLNNSNNNNNENQLSFLVYREDILFVGGLMVFENPTHFKEFLDSEFPDLRIKPYYML